MKLLFLLFLSLVSISANRAASCVDTLGVVQSKGMTDQTRAFPAFKKQSLFKQWKIKKGRQNNQTVEKPSKMARTALRLFIASLALFIGGVGLAYAGISILPSIILFTLSSLALALGGILSIMVLAKEKNRKSIRLACLVLLLGGISLLLVLGFDFSIL